MNLIRFVFVFLLFVSQVSFMGEYEEERTPSEIVFTIGEPTEKIIEEFIAFMAPYATREDIENLFSLRLINHFIKNIFDSVFFKVNAKNKNKITRSLMNALRSTEEQLLLGENVELYEKMRQIREPHMLYGYILESILGYSYLGYKAIVNPRDLIRNKSQILATSVILIGLFLPLTMRGVTSEIARSYLNVKNGIFNHFKKLNYVFSKNQFNQIFERASDFFKKLILEKYVENLLYKQNPLKQEDRNITFNRLTPMFNQEQEDTIIIGHPFFGSIVFELKTILDFKNFFKFSFIKINKEESTFLDVSLLPDWLLVSGRILANDNFVLNTYDFESDNESLDKFLDELQLDRNTKFLLLDRGAYNMNGMTRPSLFILINLLDRVAKKCQVDILSNVGRDVSNLFSLFPTSNEFIRRYFEPIIKELKKHIVITK